MWHFISDHISSTTNAEFICETAKQFHQQHQHASYILKGGRKRFFAKISRQTQVHSTHHLSPLESEKQGLQTIAKVNAIRTPKVICQGTCSEGDETIEYLVTEYIVFKPPSDKLWCKAGEQLAEFHRLSCQEFVDNNTFGWSADNWCGSIEQHNQPMETWAEFYLQQRILPLLNSVLTKHSEIQLPLSWQQQLTDIIGDHTPDKCLLHGDLWSGNLGFTVTEPIIFDPAIYIGDREIDLAMAKLFGGVASVFFKHYEMSWPLPAGAAKREPLYQLYPVLTHALMFGQPYITQTQQLLNQCFHHH